MNIRISVPGSLSRFISFLILLLFLAGVAQAQGKDTAIEVTGEASVVIYDDFVSGKSETRYYLIDHGKGQEMRLFFKNGAPKAFKTGKKLKVRGKGRPDGLDVESLTEMDDGTGSGSDQTSSAPVAGAETRNVLTLLVDFNDAEVNTGTSNGIDVQQARDRMFNETRSVAGWYWNSSLGTLTIPDDPDSDGIQDVFGPILIDDTYLGNPNYPNASSADCTPSTWVTKAREAWVAANPTKNIDIYRHILLIVPNYWDYNSQRACTWGGVAQLGCGTWCWAIGADARSIFHGVLAHELGHNFGFHHASTDTDNNGTINLEYGDTSDTMGSSRNWMKFNAPHVDDMGWIDPSDYELRTVIPSASAQSFDLLAMDEEAWVWPGLRALKVERTGTSDYYLSYRLPAGDYNNVNTAYRNKLNIHYGTDGSTRSYYVTGLSAGQTYNDPHNNLIITATGEVPLTVGELSTTVMRVQICQGACSTIAAPGNLTASATANDAIYLTWDDSSDNEDGFRLEHSTNGSDWLLLDEDNVTYFNHIGLATASLHYYRVQAYNSEEASGWSNTASATTNAIPPTASFNWVDDLLDVTFTDTSSDPDGTISSRSWDFGDGNTSSEANPLHSYAAAGEYTVSLTVTDNHGASDSTSTLLSIEGPPYSEHFALAESTQGGSVSGNYTLTHADETDTGSAESITERESGGKPSNRHSWLEHQWTFNIPAGAQAMLTVNAWRTDNSENDDFLFEYSTNGSAWAPMFSVDNGNTDASYYHPLTGESGTIYVRVTDNDQSSGNSNLDTVFVDYMVIRVDNDGGDELPDGNPSNLNATVADFVNVNLSWADNSSNETGFRVERRELVDLAWSSWGTAGTTGANGASFQDAGLEAATTYGYRVFAVNFAGDSVAPTNTAEVTTGTPPPPPAIELFVAANKDRAIQTPLLTWNPAETSMDVYLNGSTTALVTSVTSGWTHETGNKKGGPYTYVVCETGGISACSEPVTVTY